MKILMLFSFPGMSGPGELALSDGLGLRAKGHEVLFGCDTRRGLSEQARHQRLATSETDSAPWADRDFGTYIEQAGFQLMQELHLCKSAPWPHELIQDVLHLRRRMESAQVVHTRFSHELILAVAASKLMRCPPAIVHSVEQPLKRRPGHALKSANALIFPSAFARDRFLDASRGDIDSDKTFVLPGRVDATAFCPSGPNGGDSSEGDSNLRGELGLQEGDLVFGIISRIKVERRHDLLVRAFARVLKSLPNAKLCIFGRGEYVPNVKALIDELGVGERVIWGGYRMGEELPKAYRTLSAKIWLVQGNDGTSRAVLESLACGTPVIAGEGGAQAELVRHGVDGLVVPLQKGWQPGNLDDAAEIEALAEAMVTLGEDSLRKTMSERARERAMEFIPERRAARLEEIYLKALAHEGAH